MNLLKRFSKKKVDKELVDQLVQKSQEEVEKIKPINIIVAGKTGSGKSTLINAIFREELAKTGVGVPVTQQLEKITKEGVPISLYDTRGLELNPHAQHEVLTALSKVIKDQKGTADEIHLAYYCINANMARIEDFEIELIQAMAEHIPVIVLLTQAIGGADSEFQAYLEKIKLNAKAIMPILAEPYRIVDQQTIPAYGLQELLDLSFELVPQDVHKAFNNAQQIDMDRKVKAARRWARNYITSAFGVGFTPIPLADATLLVPMQITMLAHITAIFGLSLDKAQIVSIIAGLGGTGGATYLGKLIVSSAFKMIPGIGTVSGGLISGTTASILTMALAFSYIEVLKAISIAERNGSDLKLKEIQQVMNLNFRDQLNILSQSLPDNVKSKLLPQWIDELFR